MKVIMLDFDGVLNSSKSIRKRLLLAKQDLLVREEADYPTEPMVSNLNYIIENTGAKIVISSSWRHYHNLDEDDESKSPRFRESLKNILKKQGVIGEVIGITPNVKLSGYRGLEIKSWLEDHPEVTNYVILDDNSDMLDSQIPFFVQTKWEEGLTLDQAKKAVAILDREIL